MLTYAQVWDTMSYTVTARLRHSAAVYCLVTTTAPHQLLVTATPEAITVWTHGSSIGWQMLALQDIHPEQTPTCLSLAPASNKRRHSHSLLVGCWDGTVFFNFFQAADPWIVTNKKQPLARPRLEQAATLSCLLQRHSQQAAGAAEGLIP